MRKLLILLALALAACSQVQQPTNRSSEQQTSSKPATHVTTDASLSGVYLGMGYDKQYTFIHLADGKERAIIPEGYDIIGQTAYTPFTDYLLLNREDRAYRFTLADRSLTELPQVRINPGDHAWFSQSITEENKFYIYIEVYDPAIEGLQPMLDSRSYFYDASSNIVTTSSLKDENFVGCFVYDSLNQKFFEWRCGEGIGTSLPLWSRSINGTQRTELISPKEFGLPEDDIGIGVWYSNGYFVALGNKLMTYNPLEAKPTKMMYERSDSTANIFADIETGRPYSAIFVPETDTAIVGRSGAFTLMRLDSKTHTAIQPFEAGDIDYPNFMFIHNGGGIYLGNSSIKFVDLEHISVTREIPVNPDMEVTLIRL